MGATVTSAELGDLLEASGQPRIGKHVQVPPRTGPALPKPSKYRAVRCQDAEGNKFDSKAELRRWEVLKLLEKAGKITNLARQVPYPILINGILCGRYIADFQYYQFVDRHNADLVVEDVKGMKKVTSTYALKKRCVEAQYGIKIKEIR